MNDALAISVKEGKQVSVLITAITNEKSLPEDSAIVDLYWNRDETAIIETEKKYSNYLTKIAHNILADLEDCKESVNDTYLKAWNSMPTHRPNSLSAYLAKITRELSIDILRKRSRQKRTQYSLSLSELDECISAKGNNPEQEVEVKLLGERINKWINTLASEMQDVFIARYYFMDSIKEVAACYGMSESKVKSILHRCRIGLRECLEKEGYVI